MPFRLFALSRWQVTSFVIFQLYGYHRLENGESKRYRVASNFCLKNVRREIPLKRFSEHVSSKFITARNGS